jgi:hypothetical protein
MEETMSVNNNNLERAISAALEGPEARDLRIVDYRFNVKRAHITNNGDGSITVEGGENNYISRRRRGRPNDRIYYRFDKDGDGKIKNERFSTERGGWRAVRDRHGDRIAGAIGVVAEFVPYGTAVRRGANIANTVIPVRARERLESDLLDGSWEGEARFLIANIALQA